MLTKYLIKLETKNKNFLKNKIKFTGKMELI